MKKKILLVFTAIVAFVFSAFASEKFRVLGDNCSFNKGSSYVRGGSECNAILVKHFNFHLPGTYFDVEIVPGMTYKLSFKVKGISSRMDNGFYLRVDFKDGRDKIYSIPKTITGTEFIDDDFTFSIPSDFIGNKVQIQLFARITGDGVIYEDLKLVEIPILTNYSIKVTSPAYRQTIYHSKPIKEISGYVTVSDDVKKILISLKKGDEIIKHTEGDKFNFPNDNKITTGEYTIEAELLDSNNNRIETLKTDVRKLLPGKVEVVAGQDNNFYINGELFFPVIFTGKDTFLLRKYAVSQGVNMFIDSSDNYQELRKALDYARDINCKLIIYIPSGFNNIKTWKEKLSEILKSDILNDPALFGYLLRDEPEIHGEALEPLINAYKTLKSLDPYRPAWINGAPLGSIAQHREYSRAADIYSMDMYPVGRWNHGTIGNPKALTCIGAGTRFCVDVVENRKPVWFYLQAYAWKPAKPIYPDLTQLRFMLYDSILNGVRGIGYYSKTGGKNAIYCESFVDVLFNQTNEIHKMSRLFAEGETVNDKIYGAIHTKTFKYNDSYYLIAANYSDKACDVLMDNEYNDTSLKVLFENRTIGVKDKKINDKFSGFAVHVYAKDPLPEPVYKITAVATKENPWKILAAQLKRHIMQEQKQLEIMQRDSSSVNWIGIKKHKGKTNSRICLARKFSIESTVEIATLITSVNNVSENFIDKSYIFIDGKNVATITNWYREMKTDVTPFLSPGEHIITVQTSATDKDGSVCGFLSDLTITYSNGKVERIVSDYEWKAAYVNASEKPQKEDIEKWEKVNIISNYGKVPWVTPVIKWYKKNKKEDPLI